MYTHSPRSWNTLFYWTHVWTLCPHFNIPDYLGWDRAREDAEARTKGPRMSSIKRGDGIRPRLHFGKPEMRDGMRYGTLVRARERGGLKQQDKGTPWECGKMRRRGGMWDAQRTWAREEIEGVRRGVRQKQRRSRFTRRRTRRGSETKKMLERMGSGAIDCKVGSSQDFERKASGTRCRELTTLFK